MSSEANKVAIGTLIKHKKGFAFKSKDYIDNGTPVIRVSNFSGDTIVPNDVKFISNEIAATNEAVRLYEHDIVIATVGSWPNNPASVVGRTISVPRWANNALMNQNSVIIRAQSNSQIDQKFIYYQLKTEQFSHHLISKAQGSANQASITLDAIFSYEINWPDSGLRRATVEILEALDDRISLLRETNATLEAIAQALFKSWFVDFDPVHAKQQGRSPEGMDEATAALFPDGFEESESELGLVPRGWRVGAIEDICDFITNGGTPSRSKKEFWDGGTIPWYKTGEFADGFLLTPSERITEDGLKNSSVKQLPENAVLMAIYAAPTVGRLGVLTEPATFNQACTGMVANPSVGPWFLYWTLFFGRGWFNSRANGAAQQNISKAIVAAYKIVIPTPEILATFLQHSEPLHARIRACSEQAQTLATLRDTLLPRLISGQLRLPEAESQIEAAMI
jgi:type I restriction enzyme S subunit